MYMLIWVDMLTPKQLLFLGEVCRHLEARGYEVFRTTRQYREIDDLLRIKDINAVVVGKHGGATLVGKLTASARRVEELARLISRLHPGLSIAFASPEAARTAFGLSIPHYTINDSPHSVAVVRLTVPLSERLFSPSVIPRRVWFRLGARREQLVQYRGLDPVAWLKPYTPDFNILNSLGLEDRRPIIVFRVEEAAAAYLLGRVSEQTVIAPIVKSLIDIYGKEIQVVVLPRYIEQLAAIRSMFHDEVVVPSMAVDGTSLLFFSSVFVGAGGTMTAEAALLGVPTISCYPGETTFIERYLIREGLLSRITDPSKAVKRISQLLGNIDEEKRRQQDRAIALRKRMEDPAEAIVSYVEKAYPP
jgi:predicted glycosyltransferase